MLTLSIQMLRLCLLETRFVQNRGLNILTVRSVVVRMLIKCQESLLSEAADAQLDISKLKDQV